MGSDIDERGHYRSEIPPPFLGAKFVAALAPTRDCEDNYRENQSITKNRLHSLD